MGSNLLNKVLDAFGLIDEEYDDVLENNNHADESLDVFTGSKEKKSKVISFQAKHNARVIVCAIDGFDQVNNYCDYLKENKMVIMNFKNVDCETAQRCVDFLGGALYAIDGYIQEIASGILLLVPSGVEVSSDIKDQLIDSGVLPWVYKNNR